MRRASDIHGIISDRKASGEPFALATVVRTVAATAAKAGAKAVILPDGTHHRRLDRRRLRARRRGQGRQGRARRRPVAPRLGAAARLARPAGLAGRQGRGRRALRQEHVPEPGHHGHFHRAGAAAPAGGDLRLLAGGGGGRRSRALERLCRHRLRAGRGAGELRGARPPHRRLCAAGRRGGPALRCRLHARPRRRGGAARRRWRSTSITSPSSAAAARPRC